MNLWRSARWKSQLRRPLDHYLSGFIKRYANYVNHFTHSQWWFFKIEDGYKTIAWSQNSTKLNYAFIMDAINISKRRVNTNSQVFSTLAALWIICAESIESQKDGSEWREKRKRVWEVWWVGLPLNIPLVSPLGPAALENRLAWQHPCCNVISWSIPPKYSSC